MRTKKLISMILAVVMLMGAAPLGAINLVTKAKAMDLSTYSVGDIITFGSYPQSRVTDKETISVLDAENKTWINYGYYSGKVIGELYDGNMKPSDCMKYADIDIDNNGENDYRAVLISYYRPYCTGIYSSMSYTYQDNNGYYEGNVYYFKYEPLRWRVLDSLTGLMLCENVIDSQAYNNYVLYYDEYYGDSSMSYYASDWKNCSLRSWLNKDFYNTAFTSTEKAQIGITYNENKSNYSSKYDGANTFDKIFILSKSEVLNSKYGFNSSDLEEDTARQKKPTDYALCQGCHVSTSTSSNYLGNSYWWLRTPNDSYYAAEVVYSGYARDNDAVNDTLIGICPAFEFNPKVVEEHDKLINTSDIRISYKATTKFTPSIFVGSSDNIEYKSSDTSVATVDKDGNINTIHKGTTTITCTITDSSGKVITETCNVTVKLTLLQWLIWIFLLGFLWY